MYNVIPLQPDNAMPLAPASESSSQAEPIIQVEGLEKHYGSTIVLKDISFAIEKGEVFGVVGHSGAG